MAIKLTQNSYTNTGFYFNGLMMMSHTWQENIRNISHTVS
jgi:hypothetical protein